ncbi:HNH nuclease, partial [Mycobacterium numidiamassiliense]
VAVAESLHRQESMLTARRMAAVRHCCGIGWPRKNGARAEGRTDWRTVRLILSRTDSLSDDKLSAKVDQSLATRTGNWHGWSKLRIVNAVDATARATDPDAARERRVAAEDDRHIGINALDDGMAEI